jgi:hypothetical protein
MRCSYVLRDLARTHTPVPVRTTVQQPEEASTRADDAGEDVRGDDVKENVGNSVGYFPTMSKGQGQKVEV